MHLLEEIQTTAGERGTLLHKYSAKLPYFSILDYRAFLFGQPHSKNKDKLLELTLMPFLPEEKVFSYYQMEASLSSSDLLNRPYMLPEVFFSNEWYTYRHTGHFYVDFAHPRLFGGAFRSWGNLQEETLFCEFPKLAHLAFATQEHPICCRDKEGRPTPFLVTDLKRHTILHGLYGEALEDVSLEEIEKRVEYIEHHRSHSVHILGMAAIPWEGKHRYTQGDLVDLLTTAFLAFDGAKMVMSERKPVIHTGRWGCGAFHNSEKTVTVLQMLAAALAGVEIVFDGMNGPYARDYTELFLEEAKGLLSSKRNALEVCQEILKKQEKDLSWAPGNGVRRK